MASRKLPTVAKEISYVGFVVDKVAMAQVFSKYVSFPSQSSFRQQVHIR
jgi:hypothetical protein